MGTQRNLRPGLCTQGFEILLGRESNRVNAHLEEGGEVVGVTDLT